jgi:hypothetical protein
MRFAPLALLLFASSLAACTPAGYWTGGTVDYAMGASTDRTPGSAGALPLRVLYCGPAFAGEAISLPPRPGFVRLGDRCLLALGHEAGTCDLPTETATPIRIAVENVSTTLNVYDGYRGYRHFGPPLTVVVGGTTVESGRYVTYRFTGGDVQKATDGECATAARALPRPAPLPGATAEGNEEYWSAWRNGRLDLPPASVAR